MFSFRVLDVISNHSSCHLKKILLKKSTLTQAQGVKVFSRKQIPNLTAKCSYFISTNLSSFSIYHRHYHSKSKILLSSSSQKNMQKLSDEQLREKHSSAGDDSSNSFQPVMNVSEADGWLTLGQYTVFAWSISGAESCIVVKSEDVQVVFDMGSAPKECVRVPNVFITHGHTDHIGSVVNHIFKRILFSMKPARYFMPPHLVEPLQTVINTHYDMAELAETYRGGVANIMPMVEGDVVKINSSFFVKSFPTVHRVRSQGYILYKETKTLKPEYRGMEGFEVSALYREGTDIHDIVITPEVAYTGDTTMEVFKNPPTPDLFKVKLLITETTFVDENDKGGTSTIEKARERGHIHLVELAQNCELFEDVGHILLVHFSNKYSPKYICDCIRDKLPPRLRAKVTPATVALATRPSSY